MSEPQIPREVWGVANARGLITVELGEPEPFAAFDWEVEAQEWLENSCYTDGVKPVLIGGSALLDEVAKLRRVAEALSKVVYRDPNRQITDIREDARESMRLAEATRDALQAAGYPKSSTTEATEAT